MTDTTDTTKADALMKLAERLRMAPLSGGEHRTAHAELESAIKAAIERMSRYDGLIKVVGLDRMCFPADPVTLEALSTGCYDQWAWNEPSALEIIDVTEWNTRRNALRAIPKTEGSHG